MYSFSGQCDLLTTPRGKVYEYAPADTLVVNLNYSGSASEITITLGSQLDPYFFVDGKDLRVSGASNITRNLNFNQAGITCTAPGTSVSSKFFFF